MDRRDFLKHSVLLGLTGAAAASGCATIGVPSPEHAPPPPPVDMDAYLAQLDTSLGVIQHGDFFRDLRAVAQPHPVVEDEEFHHREALTRKALRVMAITSAFLDLREEDRMHPGMQARMWGAVDEIDQAVDSTARMLAALPADARTGIQQRLRTEEGLLGNVSTALDQKAELAGLSPKRRRELQRLVGQVGFRLREQDPSIVIDDFVGYVAKQQRDAAHRAAQSAAPSDSPAPTPAPEASPAPAPPGDLVEVAVLPPQVIESPQGPDPRTAHAHHSGRVLLTAGLSTLGFGVTVGLSGLALVTASGSLGGWWLVGAFMITAGILGFVAGLVVLIISAVRLSA